MLVIAAVTPLTPELAACSLYAAAFIVLAWIIRTVWRVCIPSLRGLREWAPRIASYAARASGTGMLSSLTAYLDRLVLVFALPPRELGLYAVAFSFSRLANVVQNALGVVMLPAMAVAGPRKPRPCTIAPSGWFCLPCSAVLGRRVLWGRQAVILLYGQGFADAEPLLLVLVVEAALACLCQVVVQLFLALERPGYSSWAQGAGFALMGIGLVVLVPQLGALGAALAVAAGSGLRLVILLSGVRLALRLPLPDLLDLGGDLRALARGAAGS